MKFVTIHTAATETEDSCFGREPGFPAIAVQGRKQFAERKIAGSTEKHEVETGGC